MKREKFDRVIEYLDDSIMRKVHLNYTASIDEESEIEEAILKVMGRKATDIEFNEIYISDEFTSILDEIEDYIKFREQAKQSRGHFEDFSHDSPFGSGNAYRSDIPMRGGE